MERLLKVKDLAQLSGFTEGFFRCGWSQKTLTLPRTKLGASVRVRESDFLQWIEEKTAGTANVAKQKAVKPAEVAQ
jgi:predicted DNA-binding transcriptional regulator AlpA